MTNSRVAIIHGALNKRGGGERVVHRLATQYDSDVFTGVYGPDNTFDFSRCNVIELGYNSIVSFLKARFSVVWEQYDVAVFSGNRPEFVQWLDLPIPTIRYCHSPVRTFWSLRDRHFREATLKNKFMRIIAAPGYRTIDYRLAQRHDRIIANSHNIRNQIDRFYSRDAEVIYPPIRTGDYRFDRVGDYWLSVNRLVPKKRINIQIDAFEKTNQRLDIVGGIDSQNPEYGKAIQRRIRHLENVRYYGEIPDQALRQKYAQCKGVVYTPHYEDFGIVPIEAMASGKPVVAVAEGGPLETVVHANTGWLIHPRTSDLRAIVTEDHDFEAFREACQRHAKQFDESVFQSKFDEIIDSVIGRH